MAVLLSINNREVLSTYGAESTDSISENRYISGWQFYFSPNVVIAILTTVCKSCLLVPIASCIGQLKWHALEQPRRLSRVEIFDAASRGPEGSLRYLWKMRNASRGEIITCVSAVVTILTLAMDPAAQLLLKFASYDVKREPGYGQSSVNAAYTFHSQLYIEYEGIVATFLC